MNIGPIIRSAISEFPKGLRPDIVAEATDSLGISAGQFCDVFAAELSRDYLSGTLSWSEADSAINALAGYIFTHIAPQSQMPEYAFAVFLAFDSAEVLDRPDAEIRTKEELKSINESRA
jgi:hypothetical protein